MPVLHTCYCPCRPTRKWLTTCCKPCTPPCCPGPGAMQLLQLPRPWPCCTTEPTALGASPCSPATCLHKSKLPSLASSASTRKSAWASSVLAPGRVPLCQTLSPASSTPASPSAACTKTSCNNWHNTPAPLMPGCNTAMPTCCKPVCLPATQPAPCALPATHPRMTRGTGCLFHCCLCWHRWHARAGCLPCCPC